MNSLAPLLLRTLSPDAAAIREAEAQLSQIERTDRNFPLSLLEIVRQGGSGIPAAPQAAAAAKSAAILFKNYAKRNWRRDVSALDDPGAAEAMRTFDVPDDVRALIKNSIVDLMCSSAPAIQRQLAEAVRVVAEADWPAQWDGLLPALVDKASPMRSAPAGDVTDAMYLSTLLGVLSTMNELFKRFRDAPASDPLWLDLKYALDVSQAPLLDLFRALAPAVTRPGVHPDRLESVLLALRLVARIFYSLNWQTIPEFFEDHQQDWMDLFYPFLEMPNPLPPNHRSNLSEDEPGPLERLQTAIIECCRLYAEKYAEEFRPHLPRFAQATFRLLAGGCRMPEPKYDELVVTGMRFVAALVASPANQTMFADPGTLQSICEHVVLPSLALTQSDRDAFEDNPLEYLRRDIESSDADTRRRVACEVVERLCRNFDDQITRLCEGYIAQRLGEYAANPRQAWVAKDVAITLFLAVIVRGQTQREGATKVKDAGVVQDFLRAHIIPEIAKADGEANPILRADAIKFVATFRQFIPKDVALLTVIPMLVSALDSRVVVVHTYAAAAIDGLLAVREIRPETSHLGYVVYGAHRFTQADLRPHLNSLLVKLFALIDATPASAAQASVANKTATANTDNEHLIMCVVRVMSVAKRDVGPVVPDILAQLGRTLARVAANPSNPIFNHFLFECIAAANKFGGESGAVSVDQLEAALNPSIDRVLKQFQPEFVPYVFQIAAQLVRLRPAGQPMSPFYRAIFDGVLHPEPWKMRANVPALVLLLEAYLVRGADQVIAGDAQKLVSLLNIFEHLLNTKSTEDSSFQLLSCIVTFCPGVAQHLALALRMSLERLQKSQSLQLASSFVVFLASLVGKLGPQVAIDAVDSIAPDLTFTLVLPRVWIPALGKVRGASERKACAVGATRFLTESPALLTRHPAVWSSLLRGTVALVAEYGDASASASASAGGGASTADHSELTDTLERMSEAGHSTAFSRLHFASDGPPDLFRDVPVPSSYVVSALARFGGTMPPGQVASLVQSALASDPKLAALLATWMNAAGVRLP